MSVTLEGLRTKGSAIFQGPGSPQKPVHKPQGGKAPSQKSTDFLRVLLGEREGVPAAEAIRATLNEAREGGKLTQKLVSQSIKALLATPKAKGATGRIRPNRIAQKCSSCGRMVPEGEGSLSRDDASGRWIVTHVGDCPQPLPFPEGRYAIENSDGDLRFYHITDIEVAVMASDNEHPVDGRAAKAIIAKVALDPHGAAIRFGQEFGVCGVCGRGLTDPESRAQGIGPVCAKKF